MSSEKSYCALCDLYFEDDVDRISHINESETHPKCGLCGERFLNKHMLRNHKVTRPHHFYCIDCDVDFNKASELQEHWEEDPAHRDPSQPIVVEDEDGDEDDYVPNSCPYDKPEWKEERLKKLEEAFGVCWEYADFYDHEYVSYLEDPPYQFGDDSDTDDWEEEEEDDAACKFTCPMCSEEDPQTICTTSCGHLFCASCVVGALKYTHKCPECDEPGEVCELRRVYISDDQ
ncbi:hypothetical protein D9758_011457 [Tetrapyrgos nigripes]|uniref:RING-type domain-containing protein n=1 Tax=Tetrapyrgos nigripes TaxID=182062 RepID=A0A8H5CPX5_9AGAR|nr:hypothetical protein D9758_011457 [Tetrapyrgos nigripes]